MPCLLWARALKEEGREDWIGSSLGLWATLFIGGLIMADKSSGWEIRLTTEGVCFGVRREDSTAGELWKSLGLDLETRGCPLNDRGDSMGGTLPMEEPVEAWFGDKNCGVSWPGFGFDPDAGDCGSLGESDIPATSSHTGKETTEEGEGRGEGRGEEKSWVGCWTGLSIFLRFGLSSLTF